MSIKWRDIPGDWEIKNETINKNFSHKLLKWSVFKNKYKDKENENGDKVKKLAYNTTYNILIAEIPPGNLKRRA